MGNDRTAGERTGLRVIRIITNIVMLAGSAAALGMLAGASRFAILALCLFMTAVALAADQLRHRVRSFPVFTISCIGFVALTALVSSLTVPKFLIPLVVISLAEVWCLYEGRIGQRPVFVPSPYYLVLPILIWMLGTFSDVKQLLALAFCMETALVLLFLAWHNQKSLDRTYYAASERARVPYGKIRRLNAGLLFLYLAAALVLCVCLTAVCSDEGTVFWLIDGVVMLIGLIVGAILWLFITLFGWMSGGGGGTAGPFNPFNIEAAEEAYPWLQTLWTVVEWVLIAAGAALILYMIYWSLYNLYYSFLSVDPETVDTRKRYHTREKRRKIRTGEGRLPERLPLLAGLGPAAGIRRAYISLVRLYPEGTKVPASYTPSQIELAVAGDEALEEEWQEIHRLYEKARFAPGLTDRGDLQRMRELVRRRSEAELRRQEMVKRKLV
ncbi:MAG: DUF4129 domain-containing protein [Lachnospiraceae bacterium]|nr:DUF4129 domain-containing protein [Lachnospiraceae bacterium]